MHPVGRLMIASTALPLAAPLLPAAAPALLGSWIALHAAFFWSLLRPGGQLFAPNIARGGGEAPEVALTFDDGPRGDETLRLLDLLDQSGIKATFFVVGRRALRYPGAVRRMIEGGHTVGNHTMNHPLAWAATGRRRATREVAEAQAVLGEITGGVPTWFRPPMGHKNVYLGEILPPLGLRQVTWSTRSLDTVIRNVDSAARRVLRRAGPGEIVLLHEGLPGTGNGGMAADLTRILAGELKGKGLRPVSLNELLRNPAARGAGSSSSTMPASGIDEPGR